ncbi:MAG: hypothetical protein AB7V42_10560 [Thermoleophilia bacterium]
MKRMCALFAAFTIAGALIAGTTTASAAGTKAGPAKVKLLKKFDTLNKRYGTIARLVTCPAARSQVLAADRVQAAAVRNPRQASLVKLRAKNVRIRTALLKITRAAGTCNLRVVTTPGEVRVVEAGGAGSPTGPAQSFAGPDGTTRVTVTLPIGTLLNGLHLDLGGLLNGTPLGNIRIVALDQLLGPLCTTPGTACVGIDVDALSTALGRLVGSIPLVGPVLQPLADQVVALLAGGDLGSLLQVTEVAPNVLALTPVGELGTLLALVQALGGSATQSLPIGQLQVIR